MKYLKLEAEILTQNQTVTSEFIQIIEDEK